ncbi:hypothetical protein CFC21_035520 [Triticum aestivum]|uniref:Uncharacterized protein n=3 Tax=Triticum TaxID=4564 RepID=A0A9R0RK16_TRITD|nr:hypothetical protein CFC21_035520 [Triticum aestivum]VAH61935.1 unnamed protein product [Triticum turgidum subsp. durum]
MHRISGGRISGDQRRISARAAAKGWSGGGEGMKSGGGRMRAQTRSSVSRSRARDLAHGCEGRLGAWGRMWDSALRVFLGSSRLSGRWEQVPKKPGEVGRKLNPECDLPTEILGVEIALSFPITSVVLLLSLNPHYT